MKYHVFLLAGRDFEYQPVMDFLDPNHYYVSKALLPMLNKPVLEWVVEEYAKSPYIEKMCIIGLSKEDIKLNVPVDYISIDPYSSLSEKYLAGLKYLEKNNLPTDKIIFSSSDCPGVKVETINSFLKEIEKKDGYDFILSVIPFEIVEESFPNSKRGVARLKDISLVQGELVQFSPYVLRKHKKVIDNILSIRKKRSFWPIFWYVSRRPRAWIKLFKILIRRGTLQDAIIAFSRAFKIKADVVILQDAGLGLDMDLPEDYERLTKYVVKIKQ